MPACALLALRCPYSGTAADFPTMSKAGDSWFESVGGGRLPSQLLGSGKLRTPP